MSFTSRAVKGQERCTTCLSSQRRWQYPHQDLFRQIFWWSYEPSEDSANMTFSSRLRMFVASFYPMNFMIFTWYIILVQMCEMFRWTRVKKGEGMPHCVGYKLSLWVLPGRKLLSKHRTSDFSLCVFSLVWSCICVSDWVKFDKVYI